MIEVEKRSNKIENKTKPPNAINNNNNNDAVTP